MFAPSGNVRGFFLMAKKPDKATQEHRDKAREEFIRILRVTGNVSESCRQVGLSRMIAYDLREKIPEFAKAWDDAIEEAVDALEAEARRRAVQGVPEGVYYEGVKVDTQQRYSDRMLEILLKAHRPDKFRENVKVEHEIGANLAQRIEKARRRAK